MSSRDRREPRGDLWSRGQAQRSTVPRGSLGDLATRPESYDPVSRLEWQSANRLRFLAPVRYQRMLVDPLSFYRGAALLMAEDLARGVSTPLSVQLSGDAHLENFGIFMSPERRLVFDVNDFDETAPGPFEWDVKRLATSLAIAAEWLNFSEHQQVNIVAAAAREYQLAMRRFAGQTRLQVWYATLDVDSLSQELRGFFTEGQRERVSDVLRHAKGKTPHRVFADLLAASAEGPRIRTDLKFVTPLDELPDAEQASELVRRVLTGYDETLSSDRRELLKQFTFIEAARQVVGVGSVGTECFAVLLEGHDRRDPFFLQIKQAQSSVLMVARDEEMQLQPGERVVEGQRLMQATPDFFLGWHTVNGSSGPRSFYVRQLYDHKATVNVARMGAAHLKTYGEVCAWALARAHARSGQASFIAGYLGKNNDFGSAMVSFALAYRERNTSDFAALARAAHRRRVVVAT